MLIQADARRMKLAMKHLILALIFGALVNMGERWQRPDLGWEATTCVDGKNCTDVSAYERVYVIGKSVPVADICLQGDASFLGSASCYKTVELFTIPVPAAPLKLMTVEEAEKANKDLRQ